MSKRFVDLIRECLTSVREIFPWDLIERLAQNPELILLDIREPYEFRMMHLQNSLNVPRGILETACEYNYEETVPLLADAREKEIVVICRSGNRSVLAAHVMEQLGYQNVCSLKTGLRGWNDYEQSLVDESGKIVTVDEADSYFTSQLRPEQIRK